jgi:tRNA(His) guanylyltransferase
VRLFINQKIIMACSKYTYVKQFETLNTLLPNTYIVIRIDGKGFHKFTALNEFAKPNEYNALKLMNKAA